MASLCKQSFTVTAAVDHSVTITPHAGGKAHAYGVEWIANYHGVLVENMGHGTARSDAYGGDTAHQLAFISQLSCVPDAVIVGLGANNILQAVGTATSYAADLQNLYSYVNAINPNASWFVLDTAHMHYPGNGMTETDEQAAEYTFAQNIGAAYVSLKDDWGSYDRASALGMNSYDNVHPSDKGGRYIGYKLSRWILN